MHGACQACAEGQGGDSELIARLVRRRQRWLKGWMAGRYYRVLWHLHRYSPKYSSLVLKSAGIGGAIRHAEENNSRGRPLHPLRGACP